LELKASPLLSISTMVFLRLPLMLKLSKEVATPKQLKISPTIYSTRLISFLKFMKSLVKRNSINIALELLFVLFLSYLTSTNLLLKKETSF
jgi:hypothetical protein